jgi:hypothetical protein
MQRAFRIIKLIFLALAALLLVAIPISGFLSAAFNWQGTCDGVDGEWACTWLEYAASEIMWASFLFIPVLFVASLLWLGMSLAEFIAEMRHKWQNRKS